MNGIVFQLRKAARVVRKLLFLEQLRVLVSGRESASGLRMRTLSWMALGLHQGLCRVAVRPLP
jgi:hypothetical protein